MVRAFTQTLMVLVVAASVIGAAPCFCEAMGVAHAVEAAPAEAPTSECCAGHVASSDQPAESDHDCPHCASGGCDAVGTLGERAPDVAASGSVPISFEFAVASATGFDGSPALWAPPPPRVDDGSLGAPSPSRQDTYARNRVIRR